MSANLFDLSAEYDALLEQGIRLSGEDKWYFINGRLAELRRRLPAEFRPCRILDFGCGIGPTTGRLATLFPDAEILGIDSAENALAHAEREYGSRRISFRHVDDMPTDESYDLCYVNGVFHHIESSERLGVLRKINQALIPGGYFAMYENNTWNFGAMMVMRRIPFDKDAKPFSVREGRRMCVQAGFSSVRGSSFLFYFPRSLGFLRFLERWFVRVPLGAQYLVLAVK